MVWCGGGSVALTRLAPQKTATAVAYCKEGRGLIKVNGCPIEVLEPEVLRLKTYEPVLLLGQGRFANVDIRIRVKGGGYTAQIYAIRQSIAKAIIAYYQKYVDEVRPAIDFLTFLHTTCQTVARTHPTSTEHPHHGVVSGHWLALSPVTGV